MSALYELFAVAQSDESALRACLKRFREKRGRAPDCVLACNADLEGWVKVARSCGLALRPHPLPRGCLLLGNLAEVAGAA